MRIHDRGTVQGYCPMGCGETLFLGEGGYVTCSRLACPQPDAVAELLADRESEHVVTFTDTGFTIRHPLRERLDGQLEDCRLHQYCMSLDGPPGKAGKYRARVNGDRWTWQEIREAS